MTTIAQTIQLSTEPYFDTEVVLENNTYRLLFRWSDRESCYYMDINNADGDAILLGTKLNPNESFLTKKDLTSYGITGFFCLFPVSSNNRTFKIVNPEDVSTHYILAYIYDEA